jgi:hypothetical protein
MKNRVVVAPIQRQPREGSRIRGRPRGQDARLPLSGLTANKCQLSGGTTHQALD